MILLLISQNFYIFESKFYENAYICGQILLKALTFAQNFHISAYIWITFAENSHVSVYFWYIFIKNFHESAYNTFFNRIKKGRVAPTISTAFLQVCSYKSVLLFLLSSRQLRRFPLVCVLPHRVSYQCYYTLFALSVSSVFR